MSGKKFTIKDLQQKPFLKIFNDTTQQYTNIVIPSKLTVGAKHPDFSAGIEIHGPLELKSTPWTETALKLYTSGSIYGTKLMFDGGQLVAGFTEPFGPGSVPGNSMWGNGLIQMTGSMCISATDQSSIKVIPPNTEGNSTFKLSVIDSSKNQILIGKVSPAIETGVQLGGLWFGGSENGSTWTYPASITCNAAEDWDQASTDTGTYISIQTTAIGTSAAAECIRITDTGQLCVGTSTPSSPAYKLVVNPYALVERHDDGSSPYITFRRSRGTDASPTEVADGSILGRLYFQGLNSNDGNYDTGAQIQAVVDGDPHSGADTSDMPTKLSFSTAAEGTSVPVDRVTIDSSGNVGIGETSPSYNLHISSTGDAALFLEADTNNTGGEDNNPFIKFSQDNTAVQSIIGLCGATDKDPENVTYTGVVNNNMLVGTTKNYGLQLGTNDNVRMTITKDGWVGIGSSAPSYPLSQIASNSGGYIARFYNSYNGSAGGIWIKAGDTSTTLSPMPFIVQDYAGTTNQFYVRQDGAYYHRGSSISTGDSKRDVVEMSESATDLLKDIRVVSYNYKEDPDDRARRIGFIADDTTNQPSIDSRLTNGGTGFDIQTLVGTLIKAVQELQSRLDVLENNE